MPKLRIQHMIVLMLVLIVAWGETVQCNAHAAPPGPTWAPTGTPMSIGTPTST